MANLINFLTNFGAGDACKAGGGPLFLFPTWYKYLQCDDDIPTSFAPFELSHIWLILLAVLEMLTYLAGVLAVVYFIYGGFSMIISQGNSEKVAKARTTMLQAVVGLVIVILSAGIVSLIAGAISG